MPQLEGWDWDEAAGLAVEWVERECAEQHSRGLLVTMTRDSGDSVPALMRFAQRHDHTSPRSWSRPDRGRSVPVYVPDEKALDSAAGICRGSSLCAVEGFRTLLSGWVRNVGAVDLTGEATALAPLDPRLTEASDPTALPRQQRLDPRLRTTGVGASSNDYASTVCSIATRSPA